MTRNDWYKQLAEENGDMAVYQLKHSRVTGRKPHRKGDWDELAARNARIAWHYALLVIAEVSV